MVATAVDMLAGGYPCFASFSDRLAFDASLEVVWYNHKRFFPFHQGLIHAPRQSPPRLKILKSVEKSEVSENRGGLSHHQPSFFSFYPLFIVLALLAQE
jgi:hypothetical protein